MPVGISAVLPLGAVAAAYCLTRASGGSNSRSLSMAGALALSLAAGKLTLAPFAFCFAARVLLQKDLSRSLATDVKAAIVVPIVSIGCGLVLRIAVTLAYI